MIPPTYDGLDRKLNARYDLAFYPYLLIGIEYLSVKHNFHSHNTGDLLVNLGQILFINRLPTSKYSWGLPNGKLIRRIASFDSECYFC